MSNWRHALLFDKTALNLLRSFSVLAKNAYNERNLLLGNSFVIRLVISVYVDFNSQDGGRGRLRVLRALKRFAFYAGSWKIQQTMTSSHWDRVEVGGPYVSRRSSICDGENVHLRSPQTLAIHSGIRKPSVGIPPWDCPPTSYLHWHFWWVLWEKCQRLAAVNLGV